MNGIPLSLRQNTFVERLRLAGYHTALIGKSHLQTMQDAGAERSIGEIAPGLSPPPPSRDDSILTSTDENYEQEIPESFSKDRRCSRTIPYYGFDRTALCTGHGDLVGGDYRLWAESIEPRIHSLSGPANALSHNYICPQAWRTAVPEELYPTRFIESTVCSQLHDWATDSQAPFFLMMSFTDPHHPFTPPGRYWDRFHPEDMWLPRSFYVDDDALPQVAWARRRRRIESSGTNGYGAIAATEQEVREAMALTAGMVAMIDDSIGQVLGTLRGLGLDRNTVVIFTSDHGDFLGDYGLLLKGPMHSQGLVRVPLIWSDPSIARRGVASSTLCSTVDISTSILERAGLAPHNGMQGISLLPAMERDVQIRDAVLIEEDAYQPHLGFEEAPRIRTLVAEGHRLSIYSTGHRELFNLREDPDETRNLWSSSRPSSIQVRLMERLAVEMMLAVDVSPRSRYVAPPQ